MKINKFFNEKTIVVIMQSMIILISGLFCYILLDFKSSTEKSINDLLTQSKQTDIEVVTLKETVSSLKEAKASNDKRIDLLEKRLDKLYDLAISKN